jgi:hypothetical protein
MKKKSCCGACVVVTLSFQGSSSRIHLPFTIRLQPFGEVQLIKADLDLLQRTCTPPLTRSNKPDPHWKKLKYLLTTKFSTQIKSGQSFLSLQHPSLYKELDPAFL